VAAITRISSAHLAVVTWVRVDRHFEETLTHGPDPFHLAEVFGLNEKTAICSADSARQPLEQAAEAAP
jgi:hypothetical protein